MRADRSRVSIKSICFTHLVEFLVVTSRIQCECTRSIGGKHQVQIPRRLGFDAVEQPARSKSRFNDISITTIFMHLSENEYQRID